MGVLALTGASAQAAQQEDRELNLALAMSILENEAKHQQESKENAALRKAIEESRKDVEKKRKQQEREERDLKIALAISVLNIADKHEAKPTQAPLKECVICMEKIAKQNIFCLTNCQHIFCRDCIKKHVNANYDAKCPLCRKQIFHDDKIKAQQ